MRLRNRGKFDPYRDDYRPGDLYERNDKWFVVGRDGSARPVAAIPDESDRGPAGPPGESIVGPPGRVGRDGVGKDGVGFNYRGEWRRQSYAINDVVEHEGSSYVCRVEGTKRQPSGDSKKYWGLLSKAGADGKDGATYYTKSIHRTETIVAGASVTAIFDSNTLAGQVIYISGDGHVDLAQANGRPQTRAIGISTRDVVAGQAGEYIPVGPVSCESWNLSAGSVYYLDPSTPGGMTTSYPTTSGLFVVILGVATAEKQLSLSIHYLLEQS